MSLQERLDQIKEGAKARIPGPLYEVMAKATADLVASGLAARAGKVGDRMPAFTLPGVSRRRVAPAALLARGPPRTPPSSCSPAATRWRGASGSSSRSRTRSATSTGSSAPTSRSPTATPPGPCPCRPATSWTGRGASPGGPPAPPPPRRRFGFDFEWTTFGWSCERYARTGRMMPEDGLDQLRRFESIFLGAVGFPRVPDHVSLWGLLIPIRRGFRQYVNLRPVRLLRGVRSPLAGRGPADIDMLIVRENNEGEYSEIGGRLYRDTPEELAVQQSIFTRRGCDRVMRYAFERAMKRPRRHVTSATKSNGIIHSMPYWDARFAAIAKDYPDVTTARYHIDILAAHFVQHPDWFDVVVASNLFGDILSDLGPAIAGSIGLAPGGNINPAKEHPATFEPVPGAAPDIAGKGIANPIAQIWTGAMLLEHLGHADAAAAVVRAIERVVEEGRTLTRDLGGRATTRGAAGGIAALGQGS